MCGIIGIASTHSVVSDIVKALKKVEYRGYDSAGIAVASSLSMRRVKGKISGLEDLLVQQPLEGTVGIGHTRWATHGEANERNAHPHATDRVALVHNGIIENYKEIKERLVLQGRTFSSDTDTEVIVHLIDSYLDDEATPHAAVQKALKELRGAFALAVVFKDVEDYMICARRGSPLVIGKGKGSMYIGSDALSLSAFTSTISYLDEGDVAIVSSEDAYIYTADGSPVSRTFQNVPSPLSSASKGEYSHFMLKEIYEQPVVVETLVRSYIKDNAVHLPSNGVDLRQCTSMHIVACGTSYYAGLMAKYWLEAVAGIPVHVDIASEFRYRQSPLPKGGLCVCISQSGETADTLAALRYAKSKGQKIVSIVNVQESAIARESHSVLPIYAGPEIGVASTKAFMGQSVVLALLALHMGAHTQENIEAIKALQELPDKLQRVLDGATYIDALARALVPATSVIYMGRSLYHPLCLEGALKLKELSYIHAEGFASGELKHGPIALVDPTVPIIACAPSDALFEKTVSNIQEVRARQGNVYVLTDDIGMEAFSDNAYSVEANHHWLTSAFLYAIPLQLLAYHVALLKGNDVDQPRNLAKSVTVE